MKTTDAEKKLRALLDGLEVQNIDTLLKRASISDFRLLGETMAIKTKELAAALDELRKAVYNLGYSLPMPLDM